MPFVFKRLGVGYTQLAKTILPPTPLYVCCCSTLRIRGQISIVSDFCRLRWYSYRLEYCKPLGAKFGACFLVVLFSCSPTLSSFTTTRTAMVIVWVEHRTRTHVCVCVCPPLWGATHRVPFKQHH